MTDVVEQIIGRMEDEYLHDDQDEILKVGEHHYLVDGSLPVDQFVEFIGFEPVPVFDYETAGGLMLDCWIRSLPRAIRTSCITRARRSR